MGEIQIDVRQRPGFKAASAMTTSGPALQLDSAACPRAGIWYIPRIYLVYTWYIPGMTLNSLLQPPLLLAVALVVLVIGTPSETGMTEIEEDRFVCLACQARHFPALFSSRRALRVHMHKSKNPKCAKEWSKIKVMTRPGDVIAGGAGGMGPCPPSQHQPPGVEYTHNIL
jgi:hypothetical protein